jgi:chitinase
VYNNKIYQAKWWTQNEQPDINTGDGKVWAYVADCSGGTNNTPPVVNITAPANNASYTAPASVTITATASDTDGAIAKVEFYNGATLLGTATASPYSYSWSNVPGGTYSLTAKATDNGGATTTSAAVTVTVTGGNGGTANCAGVATYQPYPAVYNNGDLVVYNGVLYQSLSNALYNVTPGTADWWWKPLGTCSSAAIATASASTGKSPQLTSESPAICSVYPNPVAGSSLQISLTARDGERLKIQLLDIAGHSSIRKKEYTASRQGQQFLTLDMSGVPAGIWLLKIVHVESGVTTVTKVIRL